eukprot:5872056-Pyramimonas_sp.AAC.3
MILRRSSSKVSTSVQNSARVSGSVVCDRVGWSWHETPRKQQKCPKVCKKCPIVPACWGRRFVIGSDGHEYDMPREQQ